MVDYSRSIFDVDPHTDDEEEDEFDLSSGPEGYSTSLFDVELQEEEEPVEEQERAAMPEEEELPLETEAMPPRRQGPMSSISQITSPESIRQEEETDEPSWLAGRWAAAKAAGAGAIGGTAEYLSRPQDIIAPGVVEGVLGEDVDPQFPILKQASDTLRKYAEEQRDVAHATMPENEALAFSTEIVDSAIMMAPSVAGSRITKSGNVGLGIMGTVVFGDTIAREMSNGLSPEDAAKEAWIQVLFEIGPEKAFGWFDNIAVSKGAKQWMKNNLIEGVSEMTTEELNLRYEKYHKGEDIDLASRDAWVRRVKAGVAGTTMSGVLTAPSALQRDDAAVVEEPAPTEERDEVGEQAEAALEELRSVTGLTDEQAVERTLADTGPSPRLDEDTDAALDKPVEIGDTATKTPAMENVEQLREEQDGSRGISYREGPPAAPVAQEEAAVAEPTPEVEEAIKNRSVDRKSDGKLYLPNGELATPRNAERMLNSKANASWVRQRQAIREKLEALPDDAPMKDVRATLPDSNWMTKQEALADLDARDRGSERYAAEVRAAAATQANLEQEIVAETAAAEEATVPYPEDNFLNEDRAKLEQVRALRDDADRYENEDGQKLDRIMGSDWAYTGPGAQNMTAKERAIAVLEGGIERRVAYLDNQNAQEAEQEVAPEVEPETRDTFSLKHEAIEQERVERGERPILKDVVQTNQETMTIASKMLEENPTLADDLVSNIIDGTKASASAAEHGVLLLKKVELANERSKAAEQATDETLSEEERTAASLRWAALEEDIARLENAAYVSGTEAGRALQIRKAAMDRDYSLAALEQRERITRGRPLTEEEAAEVKKYADRIAQLEKEAAEAQTKLDEYEQRVKTDALIKDMSRRLKKNVRSTAKFQQRVNEAADVSRAWLKANLHNKNAGVNPAAYYHLARIGASHIVNGAIKFNEWAAAMKKELGARVWGEVEDQSEVLFEDAQRIASDTAQEGIDGRDRALSQAVAENEAGIELSQRVVYNLAKWHVNNGVHGEAAVMAAVHADLTELFPDITEREVRQAFVAYGKVKNPSRSELQAEMAELKALVKLTEDITRLEKQEKLPKSEKKRADISLRLANKRRKFQAMLAKIESSDPELQAERFASVNQARVNRIKQQMAELQAQIELGETTPAREAVPESDEVKMLKGHRDALAATLAKIEAAKNPPKTPEEKWNDIKTKQLKRQIQDIEERIRNKDYSQAAKPEPKHMSRENLKLQSKLDARKSEFMHRQYEIMVKEAEPYVKAAVYLGRGFNALRTILTTLDASALGRQGAPLMAAYPTTVGKEAVKTAVAVWKSKDVADAINRELLHDVELAKAQKHGLFLSDPNAPDMSKREEEAMDNLIQNNKFFQIFQFAGSQRAYTITLNVIRATAWRMEKARLEEKLGRALNDAELRKLATQVNNWSGRGSAPKGVKGPAGNIANSVNTMLGALSTFLFSPRYMYSNWAKLGTMTSGMLPGTGSTKSSRMTARKLTASWMMMEVASAAFGMLMAAVTADEDDEISFSFNPTSSDFGRVKITKPDGKVIRWNLPGSLAGEIVLLSQAISGVRTTSDGTVIPIRRHGTVYGAVTDKDMEDAKLYHENILGTYLSYKMAPVIATISTLASGRDVLGEERTPLEAVGGNALPLIGQEIAELFEMSGEEWEQGLVFGALAFLGMSSSAYDPNRRESEKEGALSGPPKPITFKESKKQDREDEALILRTQ